MSTIKVNSIQTAGGLNGLTLNANGQVNVANTIGFPDGTVMGSSSSSTMKNRIINGAMVIDQRNAGNIQTIGSSYSIDRWKADRVASGGAVLTGQQVSDAPTGFNNSYKFTVTTAGAPAASDYFQWAQYIEGYNMADLGWGTVNAKPATLSFWAKSSLSATFSVGLRDGGFAYSYVIPFTTSTPGTWQFFSFTITPPTVGTFSTTNGYGLDIHFCPGVGSTVGTTNTNTWFSGNVIGYTSSGILANNGATLQIAGVQLEKGSTATSFDYRPYGTELALCQRYFTKNTGYSSVVGSRYGPSKVYATYSLPATMRTTPSLSNSGNWYIVNTTGGEADAAPTLYSIVSGGLLGNNVDCVWSTSFNPASYIYYVVCGQTTHSLSFSAEL
jgi:hypothetical protein